MMKYIDRLIDGITMYRLLVYYLIALLLAAIGLSATGHLGYSSVAIVLSTLYLVVVCVATNTVFGRVFEVPVNVESSYITALILALVITPVGSSHNLLFLTAAGGLSIASKYILAFRKQHFFNPVAIALVLLAFGAQQTASWWVGNTALLPFVIVGGLILARKIRYQTSTLTMVVAFFLVTLVSTAVVNHFAGNDVIASVRNLLLHSSLFFFGFIMLTEPQTTPPTARGRLWYATLVGALFPPQVHVLAFYATPELTLSVGNLFSYAISPKLKLMPRFRQKIQIAPDIVDFVLTADKRYDYKPGQYVEVTLGHHFPDTRGNRRYLTLASSPTEHNLRFGIKFYPNGSSFKHALLNAETDTPISISSPAGEFTLPDDPAQKLVFIAGGIGVTPYRSMVKYLLDTNDRRSVVLLYAERTPDEFVYTDVFNQAERTLGMQSVYTVQQPSASWRGQQGRITPDMIADRIPDYKERLFYISGPLAMVDAVRQSLHQLGVAEHQMKTDYFPGYA